MATDTLPLLDEEDFPPRIESVHRIYRVTECSVHLEDRPTGHMPSIVLRVESPLHPPASYELFEVVLHRERALDLAAALCKAVRDQD